MLKLFGSLQPLEPKVDFPVCNRHMIQTPYPQVAKVHYRPCWHSKEPPPWPQPLGPLSMRVISQDLILLSARVHQVFYLTVEQIPAGFELQKKNKICVYEPADPWRQTEGQQTVISLKMIRSYSEPADFTVQQVSLRGLQRTASAPSSIPSLEFSTALSSS